MITKTKTNRTTILDAASEVFTEKGYGRSDLSEIAQKANVPEQELKDEFVNESALCHAWLVSLHMHSETRHEAILNSDIDPAEKVSAYFEYLHSWMLENGFAGCPFTRTVNSLAPNESPEIRAEVRNHRQYIANFFQAISKDVIEDSSTAEQLGNELFFLYSAATTESKNLEHAWPIERAKEIALESIEITRKDAISHINN